MKTILVTGFSPFGNEVVNPSYEAVKALPDMMNGDRIVKCELPTVFYESIQELERLMSLYRPEAVLCVGQAGGNSALKLEKVALNYDQARIPDNKSVQPQGVPIIPQAPDAYFSNQPLHKMIQTIRNAGIPVDMSFSAGTFVCNHVYYGLMHHIHTVNPEVRGGFIHVPYVMEQVMDKPAQPSMSLASITQGLQAALSVIFDEEIPADALQLGKTK